MAMNPSTARWGASTPTPTIAITVPWIPIFLVAAVTTTTGLITMPPLALASFRTHSRPREQKNRSRWHVINMSRQISWSDLRSKFPAHSYLHHLLQVMPRADPTRSKTKRCPWCRKYKQNRLFRRHEQSCRRKAEDMLERTRPRRRRRNESDSEVSPN